MLLKKGWMLCQRQQLRQKRSRHDQCLLFLQFDNMQKSLHVVTLLVPREKEKLHGLIPEVKVVMRALLNWTSLRSNVRAVIAMQKYQHRMKHLFLRSHNRRPVASLLHRDINP